MTLRHGRPARGVRVHELPLVIELVALELVRERVALVRALVRREADVLVGRRDPAVHAERPDVDGSVLLGEELGDVDVGLEVGPLAAVAAERRGDRIASARDPQVVGRQVHRRSGLTDAVPEGPSAVVLALDLEVRAVVGAAVVAVPGLVDADPVVVALEQPEADLCVRVIGAAVVAVETRRVDLRLDGEVALRERLAEEADLAGLGLVDRAGAEREGEVAALDARRAGAGRGRRRMPEAPPAGVERAVERVRARQAGARAVGRPAGLGAGVDAEPVEGRRAAAIAAAEGGEAHPQRGRDRRRVARAADQRPGLRRHRARTRR